MGTNKKVRGLKTWLKENGYTEEQMQAFWNELIPLNLKINALHTSGINWDETNLSLIAQLPTEKERTLQRKAEREKEEQRKLEEKKKMQEELEHYHKYFEEIMVKKIDSGEELSENELKTLVLEYDVETEEGESLRWEKSMFTVVKLLGRTFGIHWYQGLTECQEDSFNEQPFEVEKHEEVKITTVNNWLKKDKTKEVTNVDVESKINIKDKRIEMLASKVVIEKRNRGKEPAIFITSDNHVYMICTTNSGDFSITDEGLVGHRYDSDGNWLLPY